MDGGNEYVIQVKANQELLMREIIDTISDNPPLDESVITERNKGRQEKRTVRVYNIGRGRHSQAWFKLNRFLHVVNEGIRGDHAYREDHYYITSLAVNDAAIFAKGIRGHWSIENLLHRVKDVEQREDANLIINKHIASNLSIIKSLVISIFRIHGYHSIKRAYERYRNRVEDTCQLIGIRLI